MPARSQVPRTLKIAYTLWMAVWVPVYWMKVGPVNFLWVCDVANFLLLAALWLESPLVVSSQAVSVLLVQTAWMVDFFTRLLAGFHPIGGTEYMFNQAEPLWTRSLSLFHVFVPLLLLWLVRRLGYDRRGWILQTAVAWLVLPLSFVVADPAKNLNWLWAPFGIEQTWMPPLAFLGVAMLVYPLLLYLPTHLALDAWAKRPQRIRRLP